MMIPVFFAVYVYVTARFGLRLLGWAESAAEAGVEQARAREDMLVYNSIVTQVRYKVTGTLSVL